MLPEEIAGQKVDNGIYREELDRRAAQKLATATEALAAATGAIRAVLALHRDVSDAFTYPRCAECGCDWPCSTSIILREGLTP